MLEPATEDEYIDVVCPRCGADKPEFQFQLNLTCIVGCPNCGMRYVNPRANHEALKRKLQAWSEQDVVDSERLQQAFCSASMEYYGRFEKALSRHVKCGKKELLDIGCGTGAFMKVASRAGWDVQGLELGKESANYVNRELGLPVQRMSLYEYDPGDCRFDAVAMIEVIEHLEFPGKALQNAHRWLKPDGLLLVTTPNYNSLYRRLFGQGWWVINCEDEHIVFYTLESLQAHLEERGFVVIERRIQGLDVLGMLRELRSRKSEQAFKQAQEAYYEARREKGRVKLLLEKLHLLKMTRRLYRLLEVAYMPEWSPLYEAGEQLVVIARRKSEFP